MNKNLYQRIPYSFSRQNHHKEDIHHGKLCQQLQTNEQSDTSEFHQLNNSTFKVKNFSSLVKSLTEENQYYRQALKTAETLISNYQKENISLKEESNRNHKQINKLNAKLQNLQRVLLKLFECSKSTKASQKNTKSSFYPDGKQNLKTFYNSDDEIQYNDIQNKIQKIIDQQLHYEDQILELNKKIKLLQKIHNSEVKLSQKNKLKTSIYVPFTQTEAINEEKTRITNQLIDLYGNEKTIKTVVNKQSQFKKNLQRQFEMFLSSKRSTTKSKSTVLRTPCNQNSKSTNNISISTQKKNCSCRKSTSIPKR